MNYKVVLISLMHTDIDMYENISLEAVAACMRKNNCKVTMIKQRGEDIDYDCIKEIAPDFIGFSIEYCILNDVIDVAAKCKKLLKNVIIFAEGKYSSYNFEFILESIPQIDFVILGEAEYVIDNIIRSFYEKKEKKNVNSIAYRENNSIVKNDSVIYDKNMDELPFIARDLILDDAKLVTVFSSKGCTGNCTFCEKKYFYPEWRGRSPQNFVKEIIQIEESIKPNIYMISDCSFDDPDKEGNRLKEICQRIIENELDIYYCTSFKARFYKKSNEELNNLLIKSGIVAALIGIESGNNDDLKLYNKAATVEDNRRIIKYFENLGVLVIPSFICFNPFSTKDSLYKNLQFLKEIGQSIRFITFLDILEYTPMYRKVCEAGLIIEKKRNVGNYSYNYNYFDNSVYQYNFKDAEIEILATYLRDFIYKLNFYYNNLYNDYLFYLERHKLQMRYIWRKSLNHGEETIVNELSEHFRKLEEINLHFDEILNRWLEEMLEFVCKDTKYSELDIISEKYDIIKNFTNVVIALANERKKIVYKIYKSFPNLIEQWI